MTSIKYNKLQQWHIALTIDTRHHALTILHLLHERSHPIPTIPFSLQRGITHTGMGESWMVDGEAAVMTMAMISSNSPSRQGARTEFLIPELGFLVAAELWSVSGRIVCCPHVFSSGEIRSPKGGHQEPHEVASPGLGAGPPLPRWGVVWGPCPPSPLRFLAPWVF